MKLKEAGHIKNDARRDNHKEFIRKTLYILFASECIACFYRK